MEWLLVTIAAGVVVAVVIRTLLCYVIDKMAAARAAYNLELDREMLRNLKAKIEKAREDRQP